MKWAEDLWRLDVYLSPLSYHVLLTVNLSSWRFVYSVFSIRLEYLTLNIITFKIDMFQKLLVNDNHHSTQLIVSMSKSIILNWILFSGIDQEGGDSAEEVDWASATNVLQLHRYS